MSFTIISAGITVFAIGCITFLVSRILEYKKKALSIQATTQIKGKPGGWESKIDQVPEAKKYAIAIYDEQFAICNKAVEQKRMTQEDATKILKPLFDKIKFLENVEKYEPAARFGARIADRGQKVVEKMLGDMI